MDIILEDKPHVIYINGFGSLNSKKKCDIEKWCAEQDYKFTDFHYPNTYHPQKIIDKMTNIIDDNFDTIFVGCSLGGFWSLAFQHIQAR